MSRDLSGVDGGSVRLYSLRKDKQRGSAVETKVGKIRASSLLTFTMNKNNLVMAKTG